MVVELYISDFRGRKSESEKIDENSKESWIFDSRNKKVEFGKSEVEKWKDS